MATLQFSALRFSAVTHLLCSLKVALLTLTSRPAILVIVLRIDKLCSHANIGWHVEMASYMGYMTVDGEERGESGEGTQGDW